MRRAFLFTAKLLAMFLFTAMAFPVVAANPFAIILDAGHGGKDYGAKGTSAYEKDINLAVSKLIAEHLRKNYQNIDVLMTRDDDTYLTLKERADFANHNGGDLFVSVHVNSVDKRNKSRNSIKGASVYTLGLHKTDANFEVAKRENSVISLENDYTATYEGFDPNSTESYIIFELGQSKHMGQSIALAQQIQQALTGKAGRADRGVRQAGFWVLWATGMPSVLIELDFICNPVQEKFMSSKSGQKKMAVAIADAIGQYAVGHGAGNVVSASLFEDFTEDPAEDEPEPLQPVKTEDSPNKKSNASTYHIQILASAKAIKKNSNEFKGYKASEYREGKWYKYYVGSFENINDAKKKLTELKKSFPEAFIIEMRDGKRVINR